MVRRYICPYGDGDREILTVRKIEVPKVILTCDSVAADIEAEALVSRGSLLGYKNEIPVYASIDGIIAHIAERTESYKKIVYDITVRRRRHGKELWSEIPFFEQAGGSYFLQQLGISKGAVEREHTVYVNAVEAEPYAVSGYSLLMTETAKVVLGAAVLGQCMSAEKIVFYIERCFDAADYLLNKYIKKYGKIFAEINFEVHDMPRHYPMKSQLPQAVFDVQTAVWAYQGFYEHEPAMQVCAAVSVFDGCIGKEQLQKTEVLRFPAGAVIEDILFHMDIKNDGLTGKRFVIGGPMSGRAANRNEAVGLFARQLCVFDEEKTGAFLTDASGCIGCHLCERACPARVTPYLLNEKTLTDCIGCNICSYICPVKISLGERIRRAKYDKKPSECVRATGRPKSPYAGLSARRSKSRYVELSDGAAIPAAVQKSDAPPHIHSGHSERRVYWAWIGAAGAVAAVKIAAEGFFAAGQIAFAAFFFMAFHEILSGLFPFTFRKNHLLKGIADGLTVGLILTPAVPFQAVLALSFLGVLSEKILLKYKVRFHVPAAAALLLFMMYGIQNGEAAGAAVAAGAAAAAGGIFLWLSGYIYAAPAAVMFVVLLVVFHMSAGTALVLSVFFSQHFYPGGIAFWGQMRRMLLWLLILAAVYFF